MPTNKYIYIDSNIYIHHHLNMGGEQLDSELEVCKYLKYQPLSTEIVQDEIYKILRDKIENFRDIANSLQTTLNRLDPETDNGDFSEQCLQFTNDVTAECGGNIRMFFDCKGFNTLKIRDAITPEDISLIMNDYFNRKGQFSNKSKPFEFNDALQLKMLEGFIKTSDELLFLSNDTDFRGAIRNTFSNATVLQNTSDLTQHINKCLLEGAPSGEESDIIDAVQSFHSKYSRYPENKDQISTQLLDIRAEKIDNTRIDFLLKILERRKTINSNKSISIRQESS